MGAPLVSGVADQLPRPRLDAVGPRRRGRPLTLFRWVQAYAATLEKRIRRHLRSCTGSWRVDETYIKVEGVWTYLYRAVDSLGQTIDFLLSPRRDVAAAKRFFRKALAQPHTINPQTITVDKNPAYPCAIAEMKRRGGLWRFSRLRQCKYLNNIVEQDHRRIKRLVWPGLGFGGLRTAARTLAGYEAIAMIRKGRVPNVGGRDMRAQTVFADTSHVSLQPLQHNRKAYEIAIPADSFARAVVFAVRQPDDMDVNEILFRPTRQEYEARRDSTDTCQGTRA